MTQLVNFQSGTFQAVEKKVIQVEKVTTDPFSYFTTEIKIYKMPEHIKLSCTALLLCAEPLDREKRRKLELSYLDYT